METVDLTHIDWQRNITSFTSGGAYFKAAEPVDGQRCYYKLSNYDDELGFIGYESVYEFLAAKLGRLLGFAVLDCEIIKAAVQHNGKEYVTFVQKTQDFLPVGRSKAPFERVYELQHQPQETRLDFLRRLGFGQQADEMLLFDYLIYNRDRHCNNLELIKNGELELAPLFDNGVSFFAPLAGRQSEIEQFDVLSNRITNSDFGSRYLEDNLALICTDDLELPSLDEGSLRQIWFTDFQDDEGFPQWHRDKCLNLVLRRYARATAILANNSVLRNSGEVQE
ncbi:MAG: hypothetical protein LBR39_03420 [Coriobacteriales bacterium]|jgi:hypothetical protein|nr:hypothetical protein [Coriobacteriales bacterium]